MSVTKRGKAFYLAIRPSEKLVYVRTDAKSKGEARQLGSEVMIACRSGDYRAMSPQAREVCIRMFRNQGLVLPPGLNGSEPRKELTLLEVVRIFLGYEPIKQSPTLARYGYALANIVEVFGEDRPLNSIWVDDLRIYRMKRLQQKAAPATVNREISVLSKLFKTMIEMRLLKENPCRLLEPLKVGHREAYLSYADFRKILDLATAWYKPILWTIYYTGMRPGEVINLTRKAVNLNTRIIRLAGHQTKEGKPKRVPIHRDLVPLLEACMKISAIGTDKVFLINDADGVRPPSAQSLKNLWRRRVPKLEIDPRPRLYDLRHTWKTNARRSGMHSEIEQAIMGHSGRQGSVHDRYGRISDQELLDEIDKMTFDHGPTELWASSSKNVSKE